MKKTILLVLLLFCGGMFAQKSKKSAPKVAAVSPVVIKSGNASVEFVKNDLYLFVANAAKKDTLLLKKYTTKGTPLECKITSFTTKGTPLYFVTWVEKTTTETSLKKEEATTTESQIWNPATKTLMIGNTQAATKIKETVFLDKLKNASETQERMRNAGFAFTFLPDGDFILKDKSSETKYSLNTSTMKYEAAKKASATPPPPPAKKKKK